jgi:hypothetical protein
MMMDNTAYFGKGCAIMHFVISSGFTGETIERQEVLKLYETF